MGCNRVLNIGYKQLGHCINDSKLAYVSVLFILGLSSSRQCTVEPKATQQLICYAIEEIKVR